MKLEDLTILLAVAVMELPSRRAEHDWYIPFRGRARSSANEMETARKSRHTPPKRGRRRAWYVVERRSDHITAQQAPYEYYNGSENNETAGCEHGGRTRHSVVADGSVENPSRLQL